MIHLYRRLYHHRYKCFVLWRTKRRFVLQRICFFFTPLLISIILKGIWERRLGLNKKGQEHELKIIWRNTSSSVKLLGLEHATFVCWYCQPQTAQVALMLPLKDWSCNKNWVAVLGVQIISVFHPVSGVWFIVSAAIQKYLSANTKEILYLTPTFSRYQTILGVSM